MVPTQPQVQAPPEEQEPPSGLPEIPAQAVARPQHEQTRQVEFTDRTLWQKRLNGVRTLGHKHRLQPNTEATDLNEHVFKCYLTEDGVI